MKREGMTQTQLSDLSPVDRSVISRYLTAAVAPSLENAFAIIRALNRVPLRLEKSFVQILLGENGPTFHAIFLALAEADAETLKAIAHLLGAKLRI